MSARADTKFDSLDFVVEGEEASGRGETFGGDTGKVLSDIAFP